MRGVLGMNFQGTSLRWNEDKPRGRFALQVMIELSQRKLQSFREMHVESQIRISRKIPPVQAEKQTNCYVALLSKVPLIIAQSQAHS